MLPGQQPFWPALFNIQLLGIFSYVQQSHRFSLAFHPCLTQLNIWSTALGSGWVYHPLSYLVKIQTVNILRWTKSAWDRGGGHNLYYILHPITLQYYQNHWLFMAVLKSNNLHHIYFLCRLVDAFAEEQAIEDAIYYLGEALRKNVIELESFLKVCC